MFESISQNTLIFALLWLLCAIVTSYFARSKKRSPFQWFIIGLFFGIGGIILVLIVTRNDKKQFDVSPKDTVDRKLWYNRMKSEMESSKSAN